MLFGKGPIFPASMMRWKIGFPRFSYRSGRTIFTARRLNLSRQTLNFKRFASENKGGRFQELLRRKGRPLSKDDFWAIASWLFVGHGAFLLAGTTTFASIVLLVANSLQIQEFVACEIGKFLTRSTGMQVTFGSAEPNWRDGKLSFKNVQIKRGPPTIEGESDNYTQFDLQLERFDVNISLARLLEGRGLARNCVAYGIRGTVDRSHLRSIEGWRYVSQPGDFELDSVILKDVLVNIVHGDGFRTFPISIISAEFPRLRKRHLLYDIISADSVVGLFDNCLFSLHTPQVEIQEGQTKRRANYGLMRHLKIDGLNVDHFGTGVGPLAWLQKGTVDIDAFLQLPSNYRRPSEDLLDSINTTFENIKENVLLAILQNTTNVHNPPNEDEIDEVVALKEGVTRLKETYVSPLLDRLCINRDLLNVDMEEVESPKAAAAFFLNAKPSTLSFKFDLKLRNIKAHIPLQNQEISLISTAIMAKPVIAYINENRPYIPLTCRFQLDLSKFDGAWSVHESGIAEALGKGVNDSLIQLVTDKNKRLKRLKRVGLWSMYAAIKNMSYVIGNSTPLSQVYTL